MTIGAIPSQDVLKRISRHCPEALANYLDCLNCAQNNDSSEIYFDRETVDIEMSDEWHIFKRNIKKLARENVLMWAPFDKGISVELIGG